MLRRTESYAGKAQRNIAAPYQQTKYISSANEQKLAEGSSKNSLSDFVDHSNFGFKKLDDISDISFRDYCGPTPESNWVIPGVLLVGAYPASQDDEETYELITSILKERITKFVCLQQEYRDEGVTVEMWRSGNALRPYFHDVRMVVYNKAMFPDLQDFNIVDREALSFVHFPIRDCGITDDERVLELSRTLVKAISEGEIIYLHCWGGHGRTGTLVCIMLHLMYSLDPVEAMSRCQLVHDLRKCPVVVGSPQTQTQRDQVTRVIRRLMTQTHFHRRTLSDLFNHTGAARLSMMTEHSPRSEVASYRDSPNSPATLALSPFSPCGEATSPYVGKPDESIHRVGSVDEDSETEEVVAMGDSCLDDEVFINSNLVEITRGPALKLSGPFPAHEAVVSVTSTVVECNADSYIDSDTRINADISSPTNSDSKIKSPVKASSSAGGLCSSPTSHTKATASATVVSVFTPLSLTQQNHCLSDGGTKAGQVNHTTKLSGHCSAVAKVDCTDVDKSNDNQKSRDHSITGYIGNRLRSPESGLCEGAGPGRTILPTKAAASALISAETVSLNACHSGAVKGQELYPVSLTRNPIAAGSTSLSESESTMEIRSSVEAGIERIQHPVPVPPPASARPSIGTSSSATGVLAGLRNFRMQWAGSSGRNTPVPDNGDICLTPSVTGTEWDDGAPHNISAYKQLDSDLSSR